MVKPLRMMRGKCCGPTLNGLRIISVKNTLAKVRAAFAMPALVSVAA